MQPLPQRTLYPLSASPPVYPVPSYPLHSSFPLLSLYASTRWRFAYDPHDPSVRALTWMHRLKTRTLAHARARARARLPANANAHTHVHARAHARTRTRARSRTGPRLRTPAQPTKAQQRTQPTNPPIHSTKHYTHIQAHAPTYARARDYIMIHTLSRTHIRRCRACPVGPATSTRRTSCPTPATAPPWSAHNGPTVNAPPSPDSLKTKRSHFRAAVSRPRRAQSSLLCRCSAASPHLRDALLSAAALQLHRTVAPSRSPERVACNDASTQREVGRTGGRAGGGALTECICTNTQIHTPCPRLRWRGGQVFFVLSGCDMQGSVNWSVSVCACVRARERAFVHACARVHARARACVCARVTSVDRRSSDYDAML